MPIVCLLPTVSQTGGEDNVGINVSLISWSRSGPPPPLSQIFFLLRAMHSVISLIWYATWRDRIVRHYYFEVIS